MWKKFKKNLNLPESYISMGLGLLVVIVAGMLIFNYFKANQVKDTQTSQSSTEFSDEKKAEPVVSLPTTYQVVSGDNLWSIAEKHYHSGYNWVNIARENKLENPDVIRSGQTLSIPKAETISGVTTVPLQPGERIEANTHTITVGDNLWHIALRTYGDGYMWVKIAEVNNLSNPNVIHVGNVLKLPR